ncbi:MAG: glycoside hydrolase family 13 protein [Bacteroidota bacterium]
MKRFSLLFCTFFVFSTLFSQNPPIERIEPPFWWTGMQNKELQLLVYGPNVSFSRVSIDYPGVNLNGVTQVENANYLFLNLSIDETAKAGLIPILFKGPFTGAIQYELKERKVGSAERGGVNAEDFVYLLMPDRFANGDPANDNVAGMHEAEASRSAQYGRHGGDLQGVIDHLDYLDDLGVTALWLNPVLENDQKEESYHGYAATDQYRIDRRFGTNDLYRKLADELHQRDMKLIWDIIFNHVGDQHWLVQDLPERSWLHHWEEYTNTNYRLTTLMDPYASDYDRDRMRNGWFVKHMPDLNQNNPRLATYLIQNSIWWAEFAGLDGFRVDTYAYPDQAFMKQWTEAVKAEFPNIGIFGETWDHGVSFQSYFLNTQPALPGVTDFQLHFALNDALTKDFGWTEGLMRLYYVLAQDFVYPDATKNVLFLDNHDISRYYSVVGENIDSYKMGLAFLLTTRGIPQIYYGTEILMKNYLDPDNHDSVREEFPGGWTGDKINKFIATGRNAKENEAFNYLRSLARFRKSSSALKSGTLTQFVPEDGTYVYFRTDAAQSVMIVMNQNQEEKELDMKRFQEKTHVFTVGKDVVSGKTYSLSGKLKVPARQALVLELR